MRISNNPLIIGAAECFGELVFKRSISLLGTTLSFVFAFTLVDAPYAFAATAPSAVRSLAVESKSSGTVNLTWQAPSDAGSGLTDYVVEHSLDRTTWSRFDDGLSTNLSASVTGLDRTKFYFFRVAAVSDDAVGPWAETPKRLPKVVVGNHHAHALLSDGSVRSWGRHTSWELQDGTAPSSPTAGKTSPVTSNTPAGIENLYTGGSHSCVLVSGALSCWGYDVNGQVGRGSISNPRQTIAPVVGMTGRTVTSAALGFNHTCALINNGTVFCWGAGNFGQIGDGLAATTNRLNPVQVSGITTAKQLALGWDHSCALLMDGTVRCWGLGTSGQLGNGAVVNSSVPVAVSNLSGVTSISSKGSATCALAGDGSVRCWGRNLEGQLGNNSLTNSSVPVAVFGIANAAEVGVGESYACARLNDNTATCWGRNLEGQLGNGTTVNSPVPTDVAGLSNIDSLSVGGGGPCAVLTTADIKCWGYNAFGQIGIGNLTNQVRPVSILANAFAPHSQATAPVGKPQAPTLNTATTTSTTSVSLSWSARDNGGRDITDYVVQHSSDLGANWTTFADGTATTTSTNITSLTRGISYQFRVSAVNSEGTSVTSNVLSAETKFSPTAPRSVSIKSKTKDSLYLTWNAPTDDGAVTPGGGSVTDYKIETSLDGINWTIFEDAVSTTPFTTITELTRGANYQVRVSAINSIGSGVSALAVPESAGLNIPAELPVAPSNFTVSNRSQTGLTLNWQLTDNGGRAPTDFLVQYKATDGGWLTLPYSAGSATSLDITGLTKGTEYQFRVAAVTPEGTGPYGTTGGTYWSATPPTSVQGLSVTGKTASSLSLNWAEPADNGGRPINDYVVEYSSNGSSWTVFSDGVSTQTNTQITELTRGISYQVRVRAANSEGLSPAVLTRLPISVEVFTTSSSIPSRSVVSYPRCYSGTSTNIDFNWGLNRPFNATCPADYFMTRYTGTLVVPGTTERQVTFTAISDDGIHVTINGDNIISGWTQSTRNISRTVSLIPGQVYDFEIWHLEATGYANVGLYWNINGTLELVPATAFIGGSLLSEATPATTPDSPQISTTSKSSTSASLSWTTPDNGGRPITDYRIQFSSNAGSTWTTFNDAVSTSTSATVTGLTRGTSYIFQVAAINAEGVGAYSPASPEVVPAVVPGAPTSLVLASKTATSLSLSWAAPTDNGGRPITDYIVEYVLDGGSWTTFEDGISTSTSATITGLNRGSIYFARVKAVTAEGTSVATNQLEMIPAEKPSSVSNVISTAKTATSAAISWTAPIDNGGRPITDYRIQYSSNAGLTWTTFSDAVSTATSTTVTGLTRGTTYYFQVAAVTPEGTSTYLALTGSVIPLAPPGSPTSIALTGKTSTSLSLSWAAPADDGGRAITDYVIEYSDNGTNWTIFDDGVSTSTAATVTGLTRGTSYQVRVRAANAEGSSNSVTLSSLIPAQTPSAVRNVSITAIEATAASISWTAPLDNGGRALTDYQVEFSSNSGSTWATFADGLSTSTSTTVTGLVRGTPYVFRVAAISPEGVGSHSTISSVAVPSVIPGAPTSLATTGKSATSISLLWSAPADDGGRAITDYMVEYRTSSSNWTTFSDGISSETNMTVTGLDRGASYTFRIRAVTLRGQGVPVSYSQTTSASSLRMTTYNTGVDGQPIIGGSYTVCRSNFTINNVDFFWGDARVVSPCSADRFMSKFVGSIRLPNGIPSQQVRFFATVDDGAFIKFNDTSLSQGWVSAAGSRVALGSADMQVGINYPFEAWHFDWVSTSRMTLEWEINGTIGVIPAEAFTPLSNLFEIPASAPAPPTSITLSSKSATSATIAWTAPDNGGRAITDYLVQVSGNNGLTWTTFNDSNSVSTSTTITGLARGTRYVFRVAAVNPEGTGTYSVASDPVIPAVAPRAPSSIWLSGVSATSLSIAWSASSDNGGQPVTDYLIDYSTDGFTWTQFEDGESITTSATITGLTRGTTYQVRVRAVNLEGPSSATSIGSLVPAVAPSAPSDVVVLGKTATSVTLSWTAPLDNGGRPISYYAIFFSLDDGQSWLQHSISSSDSTQVTLFGLTPDAPYMFRVEAGNSAGTGTSSPPSQVVYPRSAPEVPANLKVMDTKADRTNSAVAFSWSKVVSQTLITDYVVSVSSDAGSSWSEPISTNQTRREIDPENFAYTVTGLGSATARLVRVAAVNADGQGPWSEPLLVTTRGAKQIRVSIQAPDGTPISGGAITWEMIPRTTWSTKTYGLTADGVIDFPAAPAGSVRVSLTNGVLPDGTTVSGSWVTTLGYNRTLLTVPTAPIGTRTISVKLPNGNGIGNVSIDASSANYNLRSSVSLNGFTFSRSVSQTVGTTNSSGIFRVTGFLESSRFYNPTVVATYDDGVITQQQTVLFTDETSIELDYAPWIEATGSAFTGSTGDAIPVTLALETIDDLSRSKSGINSPLQAGVGVTLVQAGASNAAACGNKGAKSQLTGKTNSAGKITLKVCGKKSGTYTIKTSGALPSGTVNVRVAGAPSTPVTSATVSSNAVGQIRSSWNAPAYLGGAPILQYKIVATAAGSPTVTKINKATVNRSGAVTKAAATSMTLTGLANAKTYTVKIYAITKFGTSDPVTVIVPVA